MIDVDNSAEEFFKSMPNDLLVKLALSDWFALQRICIALTLDIQLLIEASEKKEKRDLES